MTVQTQAATTSALTPLLQQASRVGEELKLFRSAAVTSENRATPLARSVLAAMVAGSMTETTLTVAVLHSFGNPKTPKGKPLDKLSGSGDHLPGFGATRKTVAAIVDIFANIDADKPVPVDPEQPEGETIGEGKVRSIVISFILNEQGAPKSLRALREAVRAAIAAHVAATSPDNSDAVEENEQQEQQEQEQQAPMSLIDRVNALTVAYQAASPEERVAAHDALQTLFSKVNADVAAEQGVEQPELEPAE